VSVGRRRRRNTYGREGDPWPAKKETPDFSPKPPPFPGIDRRLGWGVRGVGRHCCIAQGEGRFEFP
jgi:hypothetical protein